jgi:fructoselysine-6-P-deglycase FrlB-like protein
MKRQTIAFVACNHERIYAFAGGSSDHTASFAGHWIEEAVLFREFKCCCW